MGAACSTEKNQTVRGETWQRRVEGKKKEVRIRVSTLEFTPVKLTTESAANDKVHSKTYHDESVIRSCCPTGVVL